MAISQVLQNYSSYNLPYDPEIKKERKRKKKNVIRFDFCSDYIASIIADIGG
jgi:hypothetical protein